MNKLFTLAVNMVVSWSVCACLWIKWSRVKMVVTTMDTLKSDWTHYVYYTTPLFSSVFCLILRLLSCILSEDDNLIWSIHSSHNLSGIPKQALLCNKNSVSNLILRYPFWSQPVQDRLRDIVLCSWARHFILTVPLSTPVFK